ncbi:type II toxin-antitoxin system Phd/YefM family antitoxin [Aliiroseovarius sp. CAU 1755]|uniref:type II toxin-antitoxin system Phd/YefM family antitoxin n=1 Tax=Aliiroseovarius sp. S1339 TaxID=2936990 RepID=UPI0020BDBFE6|nr:type II toxin-antitoxin system prevent-host-death family antitoxin [Aliiroseovarius sp. S1339]MCK8463524.1 type II toxin-antitoxin system Phd/YefM family antitoxin [Aliiroseovarius sp. S1339]
MRFFSSTALKQTLGDVLEAARQGPVAITRHKKPRFVLMTVREYEQLFRKDDLRVFSAEEMPSEHLAMLEASLAGNPGETVE